MGLGDFWIQSNNGKKEQLNDTKHGVRKEQVDKKFHNLFDAYDANNDGTLEESEVQTIFGHLKNFAGDNVLDSAENKKAQSIFAEQVNMQDVDFQGFIKSVSDATADIVSSEEKATSDGGKEIKTEYKDGTTETIAYYSNGDFKWKKIEKKFQKTTYEMILDGKRQELTEEQYNQALKKLNEKPQPKVQKGLEGQKRIIFPQPTLSVEVKTTTNEWEEHTQEYSPRFVAEKLGADINTEEGQKIVERMSYLPKEALDQIKDGAELKDVLSSNELSSSFDNISNVLELLYGVTLRNEEEFEASKPQREKIMQQIQTVGIMSELYARVAEFNDAYTDNQGLFGMGSEGIGYLLNKVGIQGENHYQWADSCREFIQKINEFKVLNPAKFEEEFKGLTGKDKFNVDALQKMVELSKNNKALDEEGNYTEEFKQAVKDFSNFDVSNPNAKAWYHPDNLISGFGEALIMIMTLGWGAETKAGQMLATSTMATFGKAGVSIASKQVNNRLLQGALRLSGQGVKLLGPALNEGTKMYAYTAAVGTATNVANRAIKFDSEENTLDKFLNTEAMVLDSATGSFGFGAFAGVFGSTVTQKVMQSASRVSTKVGTALSDKFAKGAVDANEVFATILEKSAPTKIAEAAAFATDVLGFTAFESAIAICKNIDGFPDDVKFEDVVNVIWEEFKGQGYNLGQIKGISYLIMMLTGSRSARMQATRYMRENMPQLRGATVEGVNGGKNGYKINLPDGRKIECKNTTEYISALHLMVRGETAFSGKFDARNTNRGTETSDVAILTTQGETIERRQVQLTNTELSEPDFAEISSDFAQNHKSYELYSDNDGNNVVMIVAVAGERPNPRAGIPFTYEVYRFDKDGKQIAEPLKGLSEKEAKKYQLENKQFGSIQSVIAEELTNYENEINRIKQKYGITEKLELELQDPKRVSQTFGDDVHYRLTDSKHNISFKFDKKTGKLVSIITPDKTYNVENNTARNGVHTETSEVTNPIEQRLAVANDRESFVAIRDEIQKLPNGEEKTRLIQAYLKKYNEWSSDPSRPDIRMQYIPEAKNQGADKTPSQENTTAVKTTVEDKINELRNKCQFVITKSFKVNGNKDVSFEIFLGSKEASNDAYYVLDRNTGVLYYAKYPRMPELEILAADIYKLAGMNVPELELFISPDGKTGVLSKYIPNLQDIRTPNKTLYEGYAIDALLANHDVIGLDHRNSMTDGTNVYRIDMGCSFDRRGKGLKKEYSSTVKEIVSLMHPDINIDGADIFANMTKEDLIKSLEKVCNINEKDLEVLFDTETKKQFLNVVKERIVYLKEFLNQLKTTQQGNMPLIDYLQSIANVLVPKVDTNTNVSVLPIKNEKTKRVTIIEEMALDKNDINLRDNILNMHDQNGRFKRLIHAMQQAEVGYTRQEGDIIITKINKNTYKIEKEYKILDLTPEQIIENIKTICSEQEQFISHLELLYQAGELSTGFLHIIYDAVFKGRELPYEFNKSINDFKRGGYKDINRYCNGEISDDILRREAHGTGLQPKTVASLKKDIGKLSLFLEYFKTRKKLSLYRVDSFSVINEIKIESGKYKGKRLVDVLKNSNGNLSIDDVNNIINNISDFQQKAFLSTTIDKNLLVGEHPIPIMSEEIAGSSRDIIWNFTTKGEITGAFIEPFKTILSEENYEGEFLLQKNSKIHITDIKYSPTLKKWEISAEIYQ